MLKVTVDIQDRIINDQTGNFRHVELAQSSVLKVYVKFYDEKAGLKDHEIFLFKQIKFLLKKVELRFQ